MQLTTSHPGERELQDFVNGLLSGPRSGAISLHLESCDECCTRLESLTAAHSDDRLVRALCGAMANSDSSADTLIPEANAGSVLRRVTGRINSAGESTHPTAAPQRRRTLRRPRVPEISRFEFQDWIGQGAFGVVWLARDPVLRRNVAVKVPRGGAFPDDALRERFLREAQAAAAAESSGNRADS
ncbi:MAG: hypothetical protein R3C19_19205 [Planctomycetaceae bacterium]